MGRTRRKEKTDKRFRLKKGKDLNRKNRRQVEEILRDNYKKEVEGLKAIEQFEEETTSSFYHLDNFEYSSLEE